MNKENKEKVNEIIECLRKLDDQLHKLYLQEQEPFNKAILSEYLLPRDRDLKTKIRGKNICNLSRATCQISEVLNQLDEILCREVTE